MSANMLRNIRRGIYLVAMAALPILVGTDLITDSTAGLTASILAAVLVPGVALVNTKGPADEGAPSTRPSPTTLPRGWHHAD